MALQGRTAAVRLTEVVNGFGVGGTERQLVEVLRRLHPPEFELDVCCLELEGEFLEDVAALGHTPAEFHLRGSLVQPHTLLQVARLARRVRAHGSALVHCHDFYSNLVGSAAAAARVPVIVSRRDLGAWIGPARATALRLVTRHATRVLCNAGAVRERVMREGVPGERIDVVHNGLDIARFDAQLRAPLRAPLRVPRGEGPLVACVANMKHPVKGHTDLLLAFARVVRELPSARLLLVGDGALRVGLEREARALGLEHSAAFAGRRTDVPAVLARCTAVVSASHSEGLSNAIMEAMAARLPLVATAVGGNVELVQHGVTGLLAPAHRADLLAARLVELLRAPDEARRLGHEGRRRIEREFTSERMAERMARVYAALAGQVPRLRRAA